MQTGDCDQQRPSLPEVLRDEPPRTAQAHKLLTPRNTDKPDRPVNDRKTEKQRIWHKGSWWFLGCDTNRGGENTTVTTHTEQSKDPYPDNWVIIGSSFCTFVVIGRPQNNKPQPSWSPSPTTSWRIFEFNCSRCMMIESSANFLVYKFIPWFFLGGCVCSVGVGYLFIYYLFENVTFVWAAAHSSIGPNHTQAGALKRTLTTAASGATVTEGTASF